MILRKEFSAFIDDPAIPDRDSIIEVRRIVRKMSDRSGSSGRAMQLRRELDDAYISLQLAKVLGEDQMRRACVQRCHLLADEIEACHKAPGGRQRRSLQNRSGGGRRGR